MRKCPLEVNLSAYLCHFVQGLFFCTAPEPLKSPFRKLKPSPPRVTATAISAPPLAPKHLFGAPYDGLVDENYHNEALDPADFVG